MLQCPLTSSHHWKGLKKEELFCVRINSEFKQRGCEETSSSLNLGHSSSMFHDSFMIPSEVTLSMMFFAMLLGNLHFCSKSGFQSFCLLLQIPRGRFTTGESPSLTPESCYGNHYGILPRLHGELKNRIPQFNSHLLS